VSDQREHTVRLSAVWEEHWHTRGRDAARFRVRVKRDARLMARMAGHDACIVMAADGTPLERVRVNGEDLLRDFATLYRAADRAAEIAIGRYDDAGIDAARVLRIQLDEDLADEHTADEFRAIAEQAIREQNRALYNGACRALKRHSAEGAVTASMLAAAHGDP
jgi:hypothetical protein